MRMLRAIDAHGGVGNHENFTTFAYGGTFIAPSAAERSQTSSAKTGITAPPISRCCWRTGSSGRNGASRSSARLRRSDVTAG